jgi:hypothetical protein
MSDAANPIRAGQDTPPKIMIAALRISAASSQLANFQPRQAHYREIYFLLPCDSQRPPALERGLAPECGHLLSKQQNVGLGSPSPFARRQCRERCSTTSRHHHKSPVARGYSIPNVCLLCRAASHTPDATQKCSGLTPRPLALGPALLSTTGTSVMSCPHWTSAALPCDWEHHVILLLIAPALQTRAPPPSLPISSVLSHHPPTSLPPCRLRHSVCLLYIRRHEVILERRE